MSEDLKQIMGGAAGFIGEVRAQGAAQFGSYAQILPKPRSGVQTAIDGLSQRMEVLLKAASELEGKLSSVRAQRPQLSQSEQKVAEPVAQCELESQLYDLSMQVRGLSSRLESLAQDLRIG